MSKELGELVVKACKPEDFQNCDLVFSGLDSDVAGDIGSSRRVYEIVIGLISWF